MKKKSLLTLITIFFLGFIAGDFESKIIKKKIKNFKIKYFTKQDLSLTKNDKTKTTKIKANSFDLNVEELASFEVPSDGLPEYVLRTAGFQIGKSGSSYDYRIFLQNGTLIDEKKISKINLPKTIIYFLSEDNKNIFHGGLKSVFSLEKRDFALISNSISRCDYLSIIELKVRRVLIKGDCLPKDEDPDFNGSGGAYFFDNDNLYISIGTPTSDSEKTSMLAQNDKSIYGKILKISKKDLLNSNLENIDYKVYSKGHRNPQGLIKLNNQIFSTEHGPQGGDEINLILENANYGWPIKSLGTRYGDGKSYKSDKSFVDPIFSFIPSIAPSSLGVCPENLSNFYKSYDCLMSLSLREQSLYIILFDKKGNKIQNIEKINLNKRLRHYGLKINGDIFFDGNAFFVSTDDLTIMKINFLNFR